MSEHLLLKNISTGFYENKHNTKSCMGFKLSLCVQEKPLTSFHWFTAMISTASILKFISVYLLISLQQSMLVSFQVPRLPIYFSAFSIFSIYMNISAKFGAKAQVNSLSPHHFLSAWLVKNSVNENTVFPISTCSWNWPLPILFWNFDNILTEDLIRTYAINSSHQHDDACTAYLILAFFLLIYAVIFL